MISKRADWSFLYTRGIFVLERLNIPAPQTAWSPQVVNARCFSCHSASGLHTRWQAESEQGINSECTPLAERRWSWTTLQEFFCWKSCFPRESGDCHHPRLDRDCLPEVGKRRHLATQPDVLSLRRAM